MYSISLILSGAISIYTLLCFVRIFLTWIPGSERSGFGRFLCQICDPYLNLFRRFSFLRIGAMDFTPTIALLVLVGASSVLTGVLQVGRITVSGILVMLIQLVWGIISSILGLLILILAIRLIALFISKNYSSSFWSVFDQTITPLIYRISGTFSRTTLPFKTAIIISLIALALLSLGGRVVIGILVNVLRSIPF